MIAISAYCATISALFATSVDLLRSRFIFMRSWVAALLISVPYLLNGQVKTVQNESAVQSEPIEKVCGKYYPEAVPLTIVGRHFTSEELDSMKTAFLEDKPVFLGKIAWWFRSLIVPQYYTKEPASYQWNSNIVGAVVNECGEPLSSAHVLLLDDNKVVTRAKTDFNGQFLLRAKYGRYDLKVLINGYEDRIFHGVLLSHNKYSPVLLMIVPLYTNSPYSYPGRAFFLRPRDQIYIPVLAIEEEEGIQVIPIRPTISLRKKKGKPRL